jgi:hypothetical protein
MHVRTERTLSALCRALSFAKEPRRRKHRPISGFHRLYKIGRADKTRSEELQRHFRGLHGRDRGEPVPLRQWRCKRTPRCRLFVLRDVTGQFIERFQ